MHAAGQLRLPAAVNRARISELVQVFCAQVRRDERLAPFFMRAVGEEWEDHHNGLTELWSSILFGPRTYSDRLFFKFVRLKGATADDFVRWLNLWHEHTNSLLSPGDASSLQVTAHALARKAYFDLYQENVMFVMEGQRIVRCEIDPVWASCGGANDSSR